MTRVWWCVEHRTDSVESSTDAAGKWMGIAPTVCWYRRFLAPSDDQREKPCRFVKMELHPPGSRVVPEDSEHCDECGLPYDDVYSLPDYHWELIHDRAPAGLLCPACALGRLSKVLADISESVPSIGALVIERGADGEWPDWAYDAAGLRLVNVGGRGELGPHWEEPSYRMAYLNIVLDALAQASEAAE